MNDRPPQAGIDPAASVSDLLATLDKATETLELLDELGVSTREELLTLMDDLERQIDDMDAE